MKPSKDLFESVEDDAEVGRVICQEINVADSYEWDDGHSIVELEDVYCEVGQAYFSRGALTELLTPTLSDCQGIFTPVFPFRPSSGPAND